MPGYRLREGLSFCLAGDRLIFLDLKADRYFCLGPQAEQAFAALVAGEEAKADPTAVGGLEQRGLILSAEATSKPRPCGQVGAPLISLLDTHWPQPPASLVLRAASSLWTARMLLKARGLESIIRSLRRMKSEEGPGTADLAKLSLAAAAFVRAGDFISSHEQCLGHSIAVARHLGARHVPCSLVMGVQTRPFRAHCWVQSGGMVVNDRVDTVRNFTPILVA